MVTEDHVLQSDQKLRRKSGDPDCVVTKHAQANGNVTYQPPFICVIESPVISQLIQLAQIMQDGAGEQQIPRDPGIVALKEIRCVTKGNHVLQQPAQIGMVHELGCRGLAEAASNVVVVQNRNQQLL